MSDIRDINFSTQYLVFLALWSFKTHSLSRENLL